MICDGDEHQAGLDSIRVTKGKGDIAMQFSRRQFLAHSGRSAASLESQSCELLAHLTEWGKFMTYREGRPARCSLQP
jgi:hypothetical protein